MESLRKQFYFLKAFRNEKYMRTDLSVRKNNDKFGEKSAEIRKYIDTYTPEF